MTPTSVGYTVIGGYLGAGKTTLLNQILRHNSGRRFGLLINDFGALNIDAALIESRSDTQINLTNGCICCSMVDDFYGALEQIQTLRPDHIIVEASGVADVSNIAQYGHGHGLYLDSVLVLADAEHIRRQVSDRYVGRTVERQLKAADVILLSKSDLVGAQARETLLGWLETLAPGARALPAVAGDVPMSLLFGNRMDEVLRPSEAAEHADYVTWRYQSDYCATMESCRAFLAALPESVLRAKGFVRVADDSTLELQVVGSRKSIQPFRQTQATALVAIGLRHEFDRKQVDGLAVRHLSARARSPEKS